MIKFLRFSSNSVGYFQYNLMLVVVGGFIAGKPSDMCTGLIHFVELTSY